MCICDRNDFFLILKICSKVSTVLFYYSLFREICSELVPYYTLKNCVLERANCPEKQFSTMVLQVKTQQLTDSTAFCIFFERKLPPTFVVHFFSDFDNQQPSLKDHLYNGSRSKKAPYGAIPPILMCSIRTCDGLQFCQHAQQGL